MKKIIAALIVLPVFLSFATLPATAAEEYVEEFRFAIEYVYTDGRMALQCQAVNGSSMFTFTQEFEFSEWISIGGWMANDEGIAGFQFSVDDGETWQDAEDPQFSSRKDLAAAGVEYESGHDTAGFGAGKNRIPASAITGDDSELLIRAVTLEGNYVGFVKFASVSAVEGSGETDNEIVYNTFIDDLDDAMIRIPSGTSAPAEAAVEIREGGVIALRGWTVSNVGISKVVYTVDGGDALEVEGPYVKRPDVMGQYPIYTEEQGNTDRVGYGTVDQFMKLPAIKDLKVGFYDVLVLAVSADGNSTFPIIEIELEVYGEGGASTPTAAPADADDPDSSGEPVKTTDEPSGGPSQEATADPDNTQASPAAPDGKANETGAPGKSGGCNAFSVSFAGPAALCAAWVLVRKKKGEQTDCGRKGCRL